VIRSILLGFVALTAVNCGHLIHPAAVQPGWTMDVLPGHEITRHEPKAGEGGYRAPGDFASFSSSRPSLQLALGYGRRAGKHTGVQLQLSAGSLSLPTLDAYFQFLGDPLDAGAGLALAFPGFVSPYIMAGKAFGGSTQLRIDGGLRALWVFESYGPDYPAAGPMALISLQRGRWGAGLWSDAVLFNKPQYYIYCDETCMAEDLARWRVSVGLYVQFRLRDLL
jgi:hypothetical protein